MNRGEIPISILDIDGRSQPIGTVACYSAGKAPFWFDEGTGKVAIYTAASPTVLEVEDAYYIPGAVNLYDKHGARIAQSCIRRGEGLTELVTAGPETIDLPTEYRTIDQPVVYLSFLPRHWGHFLTEATSRLWARLAYPELGTMAGFYGMVANKLGDSNYAHFLSHFGLTMGENVLSSTRPVRFRKCFIPQASFSNRAEAYATHRTVFEHVSRAYLSGSETLSQQPVYLSRTQFGGARKIRREDEVEAALAKAGFRIVYPEQLSLKEQAVLFNTHTAFVGCWGSAFHNLIFALQPHACTTDVVCSSPSNANFLMFDAINGNRANYVKCMFPTSGKAQVWPDIDLEIDVAQFLDYLRTDRGLL